MKINALLFAGILALSACSDTEDSTSDNTITFNDFEAMDGWGVGSPSVNKEKAHSGRYSIKVDNGIDFSLGFEKPLGLLTKSKPKKINVSAWAYVPSSETGKANFVVSVVNPATNETSFYHETKLGEVKDFRKWVQVSNDFTLPENVTTAHVFKLYVWRAGATAPVYLDDVKITLVE